MGTVHRTGTGCETVSLGQAVVAYLAELDRLESAGTRRASGSALRILLALLGADADVLVLRGPAVGELAATWGASAPAAWKRNRETLAGLAGFCEKQGWIPVGADVPPGAGRQPDRSDDGRGYGWLRHQGSRANAGPAANLALFRRSCADEADALSSAN